MSTAGTVLRMEQLFRPRSFRVLHNYRSRSPWGRPRQEHTGPARGLESSENKNHRLQRKPLVKSPGLSFLYSRGFFLFLPSEGRSFNFKCLERKRKAGTEKENKKENRKLTTEKQKESRVNSEHYQGYHTAEA